jgi:hypothetical protein
MEGCLGQMVRDATHSGLGRGRTRQWQEDRTAHRSCKNKMRRESHGPVGIHTIMQAKQVNSPAASFVSVARWHGVVSAP